MAGRSFNLWHILQQKEKTLQQYHLERARYNRRIFFVHLLCQTCWSWSVMYSSGQSIVMCLFNTYIQLSMFACLSWYCCKRSRYFAYLRKITSEFWREDHFTSYYLIFWLLLLLLLLYCYCYEQLLLYCYCYEQFISIHRWVTYELRNCSVWKKIKCWKLEIQKFFLVWRNITYFSNCWPWRRLLNTNRIQNSNGGRCFAFLKVPGGWENLFKSL